MKGKIVNVLLGACACAFVLSAGTAAAVYAGAEEGASPVLTMKKGASVRLFEPKGIRFVTEISKEDYKEIIAADKKAEFGTLIIPTEVLGNTQITAENYKNLDAELIVTETWLADTETTKSYAGALVGTETSDGNYENFPAEFYDCELTAVSYCAYDEKVIFAENPQRYSMAYTASALLAEGQTNPFLTEITDSVLSEGLEFGADSYTLTVGETAETTLVSGGAEVTLKAVYESNNEEAVAVDENGTLTAKAAGSATITATIGKQTASVQVTAEPVAVREILDVSMTAEGDTATFDLSAYLGTEGTVSAVLDGKDISVSGTPAALVFDKQDLYAETYGNKTLVVTCVNVDTVSAAKATVCVASHVVTTVAEFNAAIPDGTYVVLAADLYFEGTSPAKNNTFSGVFDGRGYVLDGITLKNDQYLFCYTMNGTIRNVAITDLRLGVAAALYGEGKGLAENVYVRASSVQTGYGSWHTGFFGSNNVLEGNRVKNCLVVVDGVEIASGGNVYGSSGHYDGWGYLDGFYMIGVTDRCMATSETKPDGSPLDPVESKPSDGPDDCAGYADRTAMIAAVKAGEIDFGDWDRDFWAFDEDGLPVPAHMPE